MILHATNDPAMAVPAVPGAGEFLPAPGLGFVQFIPLIAAGIAAAGSIYSARYARRSQQEMQRREHQFAQELLALQAQSSVSAAVGSSQAMQIALIGGVALTGVTLLVVLLRSGKK